MAIGQSVSVLLPHHDDEDNDYDESLPIGNASTSDSITISWNFLKQKTASH